MDAIDIAAAEMLAAYARDPDAEPLRDRIVARWRLIAAAARNAALEEAVKAVLSVSDEIDDEGAILICADAIRRLKEPVQ